MTPRLSLPTLLASALAGCAAPPPASPPTSAERPAHELLYRPDRVEPGRLVDAPDGSTFAPVLTERFPYPTQVQANDAYRRHLASSPPGVTAAVAVRLFGCTPGLLDPRTVRVARYDGPIVHCATDLLDDIGRPLGRVTANFRYDGFVWIMSPVYPPREPVSWRYREASPRDPWRWVPGRDRYE